MADVVIDLQKENLDLRTKTADLQSALDIATSKITEQGTQITDLQKHNQELFLKVTQPPAKEPDADPEPDSIIDFANTLIDKIR